MASKWLKQADRATELLYEAEMMACHLFGSGLADFLKLEPAQQRKQMGKLYGALSEGRDLVHQMVETFYDENQKLGEKGD
jgi:hypothetical protein